MTVITRGARELSLRIESFPDLVKKKLVERINALTEELQERVIAAAPYKTGKLKSEIIKRTFGDRDSRVAGYVSVYAQDDNKEYAKAATLEYGTRHPRRMSGKNGIALRFGKGQKTVIGRAIKTVGIRPFEYLRGPIDAMRGEIVAQLESAVEEALQDGDQ